MASDTRTQHIHWGIGAEMLTPAGTVEINSDEGDVIGFVFPQYAEKVAAAPDLLAALEFIISENGQGFRLPEMIRRMATDAARKARGQ